MPRRVPRPQRPKPEAQTVPVAVPQSRADIRDSAARRRPAPKALSGRLQSIRPRIIAFIIAAIGGVLIAVNERTIHAERNYYPMLMLFGPVCVLYGVTGAIEPRTLNPGALPDGRTKLVCQVILASAVAAGLAAGWATAHFRYHIW